MVGTTLSHYRIVSKIGEGGMGVVYLAEDLKLHRTVALKLLPDDLVADDARRKRLLHEARAAASLEHPHIAAVHDVDEADGHVFVAMEHVRGSSLRDLIRTRKLTVRRALDIAIQVAEGLARAHDGGIVHRDLKPENILVSDEGYAKIIDFGLAKLVEPLWSAGGRTTVDAEAVKTREGQILGTVAYMAPEQARGDPVDARSDIFSFGVVLYEMITGVAPFSRASAVETLSAILNDSPPPLTPDPPQLGVGIGRILRRTLAKDPAARYQSIRDLAVDLRDLRDELGSAERSGIVVPPRRRLRPRVLTAIVVLLLLVGTGLYLLVRRSTPDRAAGTSGRPAIAVLTFDNQSGASDMSWLARGVPSMLLTSLAQTPGLDVVSARRLEEEAKQAGATNLETADQSQLSAAARAAGAGAVVMGSIYKAGPDMRLDVQVEELRTGRVILARSVRGPDVFPLVDQLAVVIRESLGLSETARARPVAEVMSPSLDAFRLYTEGVTAHRNLRLADARDLLERAVAIDGSFAMAYFQLASLATQIGDRAAAESYRRKLTEHADRLPERQRLIVDAVTAREAGDLQRSVDLLEQLVQRYPDEVDGYHELGHTYSQMRSASKTLIAYERASAMAPNDGSLRNHYGYSLLEAGRYPEALNQFEQYVRISPREPNPYDSLAEAYLITGQPQTALEKYQQALDVDPRFFSPRIGRTMAFGTLGRFDEMLAEAEELERVLERDKLPTGIAGFLRAFALSRAGRHREAEQQIAAARRSTERLKDDQLALALDLLVIWMRYERREYERVIQLADAALERSKTLGDPARTGIQLVAHLFAGASHGRLQRPERARQRLEETRSLPTEDVEGRWWQKALEVEAALAAGDLTGAEAAFDAGVPKVKMPFSLGELVPTTFANNLPFRDGRARIRKARGDLSGAIAEYRALLTPDMRQKWVAVLDPRYVLELAHLLEQSGDATGARVEYERFAALWNRADSELPEKQEAARQLGRR